MDEFINFKNSDFIKSMDSISGKRRIKLGLNMDIKSDENAFVFIEIYFYLGIDKMYKISDLNSFVNALLKNRTLYFGKKFILEPSKMFFEGIDKKIIDFLVSFKNRIDMGYLKNNEFFSQSLILKDKEAIEFIDLIWNENDRILYYEQTREFSFKDDIDLKINIENYKNDYLLKIDYSKFGDFKPISMNFKYIFFNKKSMIVRLIEGKSEIIKNINRLKNKKNKVNLRLDSNDIKIFKKDFYDKFSKKVKIKIDDKLKEKLKSYDLVNKIYFDMATRGVVSKVEFCYGEKIINPCDDNSLDRSFRDLERERIIVNEMKKLGFYIVKKLFYLNDTEKVMFLLTDDLKSLKKLAQVYYSEDFKNMHVKNFDDIGLNLGLSEDEKMIHANINLENISDEELADLLDAIKQKKKYFRLKNGSIINLNTVETDQLSDFINSLDIEGKDISNGTFDIPISRCKFIQNYLESKGIENVQIEPNLKKLMENVSNPQFEEVEISENMLNVLREYQLTGVKWLKNLAKYSFGGILADDMGLGKTLQVLAFLDSEKNKQKPSLVIAPTSLVFNWKGEAKKFVPHMKILAISGNKKTRNILIKKSLDYDLLITSYGSLNNDLETYEGLDFQYVFVDEAQYIKNPKTIKANTVKKINAKASFALTGTPIENRLTELWSIFDFIMPGYLFDYKRFKKNYEDPVLNDKNNEKIEDLKKLTNPFILRRLKKDVLLELPEKIETNYIVDLNEAQKKLYMAYYKDFKDELSFENNEEIEKNNIEIFALLTRLRQICSHPACFIDNYNEGSNKLDLAIDIITKSMETGHSIILFSQFTKILNIIREKLESMSLNYYYLDGKVPANERLELVENFNCDRESVFLISLKAGGTGLNLTRADIVIHFDPWWNPAVESQASDRAHRIGQKNVVQVYKFIAEGTIEEKIVNLQEIKKDLIESVIKPGESFLSKMNKDDIKELFEVDF
ncbi:MAG: DEAD/DEAH box helicase [Clostridiales bacterium]